jgi:hypothetical protein
MPRRRDRGRSRATNPGSFRNAAFFKTLLKKGKGYKASFLP